MKEKTSEFDIQYSLFDIQILYFTPKLTPILLITIFQHKNLFKRFTKYPRYL